LKPAIPEHSSCPFAIKQLENTKIYQSIKMASVEAYSVEHFRSLPEPHVSWAAFESAKVEQILSKDIAEIFHKHQVEDHFDITLLHKHDDIADNQRLVIVGRVMTPWSTTLIDTVNDEPGFGRIVPQAFLLKGGKFHPYEFIYLDQEELVSSSQDAEDRLSMFRDFMQEFAEIVEKKQIDGIIGLKLLTNKEKTRRKENPESREYEINDDGGAMITLSSDRDLDTADEYVLVCWGFVKGALHVKIQCIKGTNHKRHQHKHHCACLVGDHCSCLGMCSCKI